MEKTLPKESDHPPKDSANMPTAEQARELLIAVAGPRDLSAPSVKALLWRAATRLGIGLRRARAIYHREARLIGADEWFAIQRRANELGIKAGWSEAAHARLAMDLCERAPLRLASTAGDGPGGAESGAQGGGAGARAAPGSVE